MDELETLLERFRRGPELIAAALTGAAGPELDYHPPERWSVREIVAHVADSELVAADRFRRIIAEENPTLIGFDQDKWTARLDYTTRKTSQALETFRRVRADSYELLRSAPSAAFVRTGNHNERGVITLRDLLLMMAEHAEGHARQIRGVREEYKAQRLQRQGNEAR